MRSKEELLDSLLDITRDANLGRTDEPAMFVLLHIFNLILEVLIDIRDSIKK